ncbi:MAG: hypothetical protein Q7T55_26700 [Solirubrobacteraceae bacterium]|nr:hypothetical protein [Solirubrobacteraceae bacterium]
MILAAGLVPAALFLMPAAASAGPRPATCTATPSILDAAGDGHHPNTDVIAAWLTETGGRLQAVIQVSQAVWEPAHDDSEAASFAMLFGVGGATRYVRALAPRGGPLRFDHGSWTRAGGFLSDGPTTGDSSTGSAGFVAIDVPGTPAIVPGAVLGRPFVLTSDGGTNLDPHWVDAAPGGTTPETAAAGADFTVGSCLPVAPGTVVATPIPGAGSGPGVPAALTGVSLTAPAKVVGRRKTSIRGAVSPARGGVTVTITRTTRGGGAPKVFTATSATDGTYVLPVTISERATWRAIAGGLGSQTATTEVKAKVSVRVARTKAGGVVARGTVSPALPGRVLWLRSDAVVASATARPTTRGTFVLRVAHPRPGRYQALFIPSGARAERALSRSESIR